MQLWDNKLYFLSKDDKSDSLSYGDIYTYNLENNKTELLKETNACNLVVDSYGVYYEEIVDDVLAYYRLDHDGKLIERLSNPYIQSYYNFQLIARDSGVYLYDTITHEEYYLAPQDKYPYVRIYNDYFVFNEGGAFYLLNLLNGEKKIVGFLDKRFGSPVDFIFIDNNIYFHHCYMINLDFGECVVYKVRYADIKERFRPDLLYTDGSKVYALVTLYSSGNPQKLVELTFDDKEYILGKKEIGK